MADINELKEKVIDTIGTVADITRDLAGKTADRAKSLARIAKLTVEINGEKDTIKKAYTEIGKLYYETHKNDPDGFFIQLCDEVSIATGSIADKEAEIAALKAEMSGNNDTAGIDVEFENVVAEAEEVPAEEAPAEDAEAPSEDSPEE